MFDCLVEWNINNLVILHTHHNAALLFKQGINSGGAQSAGQNTVLCSRRTATLYVAKNSDTRIILRMLFLYAFSYTNGATRNITFGNNNDTAVFSFAETILDKFLQLVSLGVYFWYDGSLSS